MSVPGSKPASLIAAVSSSRPSSFDLNAGHQPPSSATPCMALRFARRAPAALYTSAVHSRLSVKLPAPTQTTM